MCPVLRLLSLQDVLYKPVALECGHIYCARCAISAAVGHDRTIGDVDRLLTTIAAYSAAYASRACPACRSVCHGRDGESVFWQIRRMRHLDHLIQQKYDPYLASSHCQHLHLCMRHLILACNRQSTFFPTYPATWICQALSNYITAHLMSSFWHSHSADIRLRSLASPDLCSVYLSTSFHVTPDHIHWLVLRACLSSSCTSQLSHARLDKAYRIMLVGRFPEEWQQRKDEDSAAQEQLKACKARQSCLKQLACCTRRLL